MTPTPLSQVPVRTADELTDRWAALLRPAVFQRRSLWLAWVARDGLVLPLVLPVDDVPRRPDERTVSGLRVLHEEVVRSRPEVCLVTFALCRPGTPEITDDDEAWIDGLAPTFDGRPEAGWSLHLVASGSVIDLLAHRYQGPGG